jgi:hypothetical protein
MFSLPSKTAPLLSSLSTAAALVECYMFFEKQGTGGGGHSCYIVQVFQRQGNAMQRAQYSICWISALPGGPDPGPGRKSGDEAVQLSIQQVYTVKVSLGQLGPGKSPSR